MLVQQQYYQSRSISPGRDQIALNCLSCDVLQACIKRNMFSTLLLAETRKLGAARPDPFMHFVDASVLYAAIT
jgi:hypothetical protein